MAAPAAATTLPQGDSVCVALAIPDPDAAGPAADYTVYTISVTHESGLRSTYEPVRGTVGTGSRVSKGQVIGTAPSARSKARSTCEISVDT